MNILPLAPENKKRKVKLSLGRARWSRAEGGQIQIRKQATKTAFCLRCQQLGSALRWGCGAHRLGEGEVNTESLSKRHDAAEQGFAQGTSVAVEMLWLVKPVRLRECPSLSRSR